jgi:hypothetical protein
MKVKDFGPTPFDYISTDLDYKLLKRLQIFEMVGSHGLHHLK